MATEQHTASHDRSRFLISDLCQMLETYLEKEQVQEVYRAYLFGAEAHEGQHRMSGEPYIFHPVSVAQILADMHMDYQSIVAAILHDVIEDTESSKEQLAKAFGEEVAELVDGVSKLTQISIESKAEAQAENFRKMMLAMTKDIRVIMIKLADRLHNMRTLGVMGPNKARRIARETLDIYAPIANRLGIGQLKWELEDLSFRYLEPSTYKRIARYLEDLRAWMRAARDREAYYQEDTWPCIVNTEVNSGNFIVNDKRRSTHLIDWEMARWGDPSSDLCHFCSPLTTLWKGNYRMSSAATSLFLQEYCRHIRSRHLRNTLIDRIRLKLPFVMLRGISWSAMGWVAYQTDYQGIRNEDTRQKLDQYMNLDFIKELFCPIMDS